MDKLKLMIATPSARGLNILETELLKRFENRIILSGRISREKEIEPACIKYEPNLLLTSTDFPDGHCYIAVRKVTILNPYLRVIGTNQKYNKHVEKALRDAGACGYLIRNNTIPFTLDFIEEVMNLRREGDKRYEFLVSYQPS